MRAVMCDVPPEILAWRKRTGADERDEVWDGVLHMAPSPNREHQELEGSLECELRLLWLPVSGGRVIHQMNVARPGTWPRDYRIPDLVLLSPERFAIDRNEYFDGGPDVVVEIRSPRDETLDKLGFYAEIGVREVWVVERDSKDLSVHALQGGHFQIEPAGPDGWIQSRASGLELRTHEGRVEMRWPLTR